MNEITPKQQESIICSQDNGQGSVVSIESSNVDLNGNISPIDNVFAVEGDRTVSSSDSLSVQSSFREDEEDIQIGRHENNVFTYKTEKSLKSKKKEETPDAREKRLDQNRKAARDSRIRKKNMVTDLQRSVTYFSRANLALQQQNEILQRYLDNALIHIRSIKPVNFYPAASNTVVTQQQKPQQQYCSLSNSSFINNQLINPKPIVQKNTFYIQHGNDRSSLNWQNIPTTNQTQPCLVAKNTLPILPQTHLYQHEHIVTSSTNITKKLIHHIPPMAPQVISPVSPPVAPAVAPPIAPSVIPPMIPQVTPQVTPPLHPPIHTPLSPHANTSVHLKDYTVPNPLANLDQIVDNEYNIPDPLIHQDTGFSNQFFDSDLKTSMETNTVPATFCSNIDTFDPIGFIPIMESSIFQELLNEFRK